MKSYKIGIKKNYKKNPPKPVDLERQMVQGRICHGTPPNFAETPTDP